MIHGLRIYPQTVEVQQGVGAQIFIHGNLSEEVSDLWYIFHPLAPALGGHVIANDFPLRLGDDGEYEDPVLGLRERFGPSLVTADVKTQLMLLNGDGFAHWAPDVHFTQGTLLPVFRTAPPFDVLKRIFWEPGNFGMTSFTWLPEMRAAIHMWDDIFWQIFTTDRSDIDLLIRAHGTDARLKLYFVDLDQEYPNPSGDELHPATPADADSGRDDR